MPLSNAGGHGPVVPSPSKVVEKEAGRSVVVLSS